MEGMLQAVVVVFMLFLCSLCLFAIIVIVRDIIHENAKNRRARDMAEIYERLDAAELADFIMKSGANRKEEKEPEAPAPVKEVMPEPVPQTPVVVEIPEPEQPAEETPEGIVLSEDENAVIFSRHTLTLEEKYATLSTEFKRYFDEIIRHATSKEGVREIKTANYYDYKNGSYKVLRLTIKRGEIVCEFQMLDRDFLNYASSSNVKMKQSATAIKVTEAAVVGAIKDCIDLVCLKIAEDKEHKKNLAKEKRRERRRMERAQNATGEKEDVKEKVNV